MCLGAFNETNAMPKQSYNFYHVADESNLYTNFIQA
jgi:hypothetical protein